MARLGSVKESAPVSCGSTTSSISVSSSSQLNRKDHSFRRRSGGLEQVMGVAVDDMLILQSIPPPANREAPAATASKFSKQHHLGTSSSSFFWKWWINLIRSCSSLCSIKVAVLLILCLQNSMFTVTRRYSQGVLKERYSKYEVLLIGEVIKMIFSAWMVGLHLSSSSSNNNSSNNNNNSPLPCTDDGSEHSHGRGNPFLRVRLLYIISKSHKMMVLAAIYGAMNILSFVSLRNIGAGMFTIFAQCKILTTATCSTLMLQRHYSSTQWRALIGLMFGVLLFSEPTLWGPNAPTHITTPSNGESANPIVGTIAVLIEVTLSGFASIYFEKVIKMDPLQLNIWERNFQLALTSFPIYLAFIVADGGGQAGLGGGWTGMTWIVAILGAAGGLLVALSIKYGDAILKTLATTGAIVLSSLLDYWILGGPLTPTMMIAAVQVILSIFNYTFDITPPPHTTKTTTSSKTTTTETNILPQQISRPSTPTFGIRRNSSKEDGDNGGVVDPNTEELVPFLVATQRSGSNHAATSKLNV